MSSLSGSDDSPQDASEEIQQRIRELATANEQILRRNRELAAVNSAITAISGALNLADVLQNITDAVRDLLHSRYAALGVADEQGRIVEFITSGISAEQRAAIGPLPQGHGLLQALITDARPLRIANIAADLRSAGFPPNHPKMKSLLGVPITFQGRVVGDLYLTDKIGAEEFSEEDQALLTLFAGHAAVAIENARLYEEVRSARDQLQAHNAELEEQYRRVQQANRLKSEFLANMSHELRTPLNAIIGFAELMHDGRVGPVSADHKEYLGDILTSSRHLLRLINDILDLAKVESGHIEIHPEPVDLTQVVSEVRDILRRLAGNKRIRLDSWVDPSVHLVIADPSRIKQILYNYLSNAIKFSPEGSTVSLRLSPEGVERFRIEVEDSGIGIHPEDMDRLFVEFQQLDASASKRYQGTGLGLALTKRIVEALGGEVGVTSTPGAGSVFYAVLPRVATPQTEDGPNHNQMSLPASQ